MLSTLLFTVSVSLNKISAQSFPDLWINNIYLTESYFQPGNSISLYYKLKNTGTGDCPFSYTGYYISADSIWDNSDIFLEYKLEYPVTAGNIGGSSLTFFLPDSLDYGNYFLLLVADFNNLRQELSEENNVSYKEITLEAPIVDFSVKAITAIPSFVVPGEKIEAKIFIVRVGWG